MQTRQTTPDTHSQDSFLCWAMRSVGLILAAASLFFFTRDITLSTTADWFFGISAVLGLLTFIASWGPQADEEPPVYRTPALEPAHARPDRRR